MNLRNVDLNLLTIFDKLIEHQNVSSAANDLGMTQSAVSHALSRLRSHFGDELFIRTPKGMVPTALALRLKPELQSVLNDIRFLMDSKPAFDPATSKHKFTIGISEYAAQALFPLYRELYYKRLLAFKLSHQTSAVMTENKYSKTVKLISSLEIFPCRTNLIIS